MPEASNVYRKFGKIFVQLQPGANISCFWNSYKHATALGSIKKIAHYSCSNPLHDRPNNLQFFNNQFTYLKECFVDLIYFKSTLYAIIVIFSL